MASTPFKIITFNIRDRYFAFPSQQVKEIIENSGNVKPIFYGGNAIKGIITYEGNLISILNTPFLLDIKGGGSEHLILICKVRGSETPAGLTVSSVRGMGFVNPPDIKAPHGNEASYISGFFREMVDNEWKVVALLDLKKFLDHALARIRCSDNSETK